MYDTLIAFHTLELIQESLLFDVDADEIYRICQEDIPQLHRVITRMMDDLKIV